MNPIANFFSPLSQLTLFPSGSEKRIIDLKMKKMYNIT